MPFVATVKETASRTSAEQALALTSPFDEMKVLTDNASYFADTLEVCILWHNVNGGQESFVAIIAAEVVGPLFYVSCFVRCSMFRAMLCVSFTCTFSRYNREAASQVEIGCLFFQLN